MYDGTNPPGSGPPQSPSPNPVSGPPPVPQPMPLPTPAPLTPPTLPPISAPTPISAPPPRSNFGSGPGVYATPRAGGAMLFNDWMKRHWKLVLLIIIGLVILFETIFQIVYPSSRLIPGTKVDGLDIGGLTKSDAATKLDKAYGALTLDIYFGKNGAAFQSPKMSDAGIGTDNSARVAALDYPTYLRFIPGSIFWAPGLEKTGDIAYTYDTNKIASYTESKVGTNCSIDPQNASLKLVDSQLQLIPSSTGGTCDITEFEQKLAQVKPDSNKANNVRIAIDETPAPVSDDMARDLAAKLNGRLAAAMPLSVDAATDSIPGHVVLGWLDFTAVVPEQTIDNTGNQSASLQFSINTDRMKAYLDQGIASKLVIKPGVSKVSTKDFTETSRANGANGRDVNVTATAQSVTDYINSKTNKAVGATQVVGPTTIYTRSYSPTSVGFSALLAQYAQDNPGTWGLAFTELSGVTNPRHASYNGDTQLPAAGIQSLYLGYTDVIQEYNGASRPVDVIAGDTNEVDCFKQMYQDFDTGCIDGFYDFYGYATIAARGRDLGLTNTSFAGRQTATTANDLQRVMVGLYKNQLGRVEGGQKILNAMRLARENEGIPTGAGKQITVIHTTGEDDSAAIHNDTAIVYDSNYGEYALTVMSKGASWDSIAGLVQKVNALKSVKIPKGAV